MTRERFSLSPPRGWRDAAQVTAVGGGSAEPLPSCTYSQTPEAATVQVTLCRCVDCQASGLPPREGSPSAPGAESFGGSTRAAAASTASWTACHFCFISELMV